MKNLRLIFVLFLIVNCTAEFAEDNNLAEATIVQPEEQTCIDDQPQVKLTNNGTDSFNFIIYGDDYAVLYDQTLLVSEDSGFIDLPNYNVIVVATNDIVYGQKIPLTLVDCDILELEVDATNVLVISGD